MTTNIRMYSVSVEKCGDLKVTMISTAALFLLVAVAQVHGHTYHLGDCPIVKPMENFDINKFLGKWYVIQKTSTGSTCLTNNYVEDKGQPGHYKLEQTSKNLILGFAKKDNIYHYTGDLVIPKSDRPAEMKVHFPLNPAGGASYTVFMTDYNTYAGIFTCQKLAFAHRRSATIISRTNSLPKEYIDKIRNKLSEFHIDPYDLSIIKQNNCTESHDTEGFISADKVAEVFRQAGDKIGGGLEFVADSAKKVYTRVRGDHDYSKEEINSEKNMKNDAEWLP